MRNFMPKCRVMFTSQTILAVYPCAQTFLYNTIAKSSIYCHPYIPASSIPLAFEYSNIIISPRSRVAGSPSDIRAEKARNTFNNSAGIIQGQAARPPVIGPTTAFLPRVWAKKNAKNRDFKA